MTFKRRGTRERRAIAEKTVLDSARELLDEGVEFAELTVEQIARRAGISRPAFYGHFVDKSALLVRLAETVVEPAYVRADEELSGLPSGPEHVDRALRSVVDPLITDVGTLRAVVQTATYDPVVRKEWRRMTARLSSSVAARIRQQQELDVALPGDASRMADVLVATVVDTIGLHTADTDVHEQDATSETLALVWRRSIYGSA